MTDEDPISGSPTWAVDQFEAARPRLRAIATRMLGSPAEADDAVQETWLRLTRTDVATIDNLGGWLTTVVSRISLNALRSRATRDETSLDPQLPDPVVRLTPPAPGPESEVVLAESIEQALLVVLDTLPAAERLAFVLHDVFATPFDEVARIMDRSPAAVRQLASRGRRRVRAGRDTADTTPSPDAATRRDVVDAFFRAARSGDLQSLVSVLDPDVVLRADAGPGHPGTAIVRGAEAVAGRAVFFAGPDRTTHPVWVDGHPGVVVTVGTEVRAVMRFAVLGDVIVAVDAVVDPDRLRHLELPLAPPT